MKINHIAMYVKDLESMKCFYQEFFGATSNNKYHNPNTGLETYFLSFEDAARLEIMSSPQAIENEKHIKQSGYIHIAFSVGSRQNVDALTQKLADAGYSVISGPRTTGDGYYESCVLDPENNQIEIVE